MAAVSYIPFAAAVILVLRKENSEFVSFHARQSLVILLVTILFLLLLPGFFKFLVAVGGCALLITGVYKALQGRKWYFPIITEMANTIDL